MTLDDLNRMDRAAFVGALGGVFEHSPWVAERAFAQAPFRDVAALHAAMVSAMRSASTEDQLALIRAHPELAGKAMVRNELTADSTREQAGAGLTQCSAEEYARLLDLNARYDAKFGFPFILAVKGYDRAGVIGTFAQRLERSREEEFEEALRQIERITRMRLEQQEMGDRWKTGDGR